jgi:lysophospholipase
MTHDRFPARIYPFAMTQSMRPAPDGWPLRVHDWPPEQRASARGSILFQGGRGDLIEKYLESCQHWHEQGWHLASFDWRGQGGSGRLAADPHVGHVDDFATWTADLLDFWQDWVVHTPGPHILIAHSMGGHLALRTIMEHQLRPDALVLSAPMLGFEIGPMPLTPIVKLVEWAARRWPERKAWPANEKPRLTGGGRQALLTHDDLRYADEMDWLSRHPELKLGPPSLNWLASAYRSTQWTEEAGRLEAIDMPMLILGTDDDQLVSPRAIRRFAKQIRGVQLHMYGAANGQPAAHELLRETDTIRDDVLMRIDHFLDKVAPPL